MKYRLKFKITGSCDGSMSQSFESGELDDLILRVTKRAYLSLKSQGHNVDINTLRIIPEKIEIELM